MVPNTAYESKKPINKIVLKDDVMSIAASEKPPTNYKPYGLKDYD